MEVLLSTMNNEIDIVQKMNVDTNIVVVNQNGFDSKEVIELDGKRVTWINSSTVGLSRSRNIALSQSEGEYCLIADDDLIYRNNYSQIIENYTKMNPNIDIFAFQVKGINKPFKKYSNKASKIWYFRSLKVASVEIVLKKESILKSNLAFDEDFGSGSIYRMGEENIFLYDALKKGLTVKFIPVTIADLFVGESSWFEGYNSKYFFDLGAIYYRMSKVLFPFLMIQFLIRKHRLYSDNISFLEAYNSMISGKNKFKQMRSKR